MTSYKSAVSLTLPIAIANDRDVSVFSEVVVSSKERQVPIGRRSEAAARIKQAQDFQPANWCSCPVCNQKSTAGYFN